MAATVAKYGRCDAVINAGIHSALPMGFGKMTEEAWAKGIDLNLNAHFHLIHKEELAVGRRGARLLADGAAGDRRADGLRRLGLGAVDDLDDLVGRLRGGWVRLRERTRARERIALHNAAKRIAHSLRQCWWN